MGNCEVQNVSNKILKYLICSFFLLVPLSPWKIKYHRIPVSVDFVIASTIIMLYILKTLLSGNCIKSFRGIKEQVLSNRLWVFIAVYIFAGFLSFTKSVSLSASISEMFRFISYILLYYIIVSEAKNKEYIYDILACLIISCFIVTLFGLVQAFTGIGLDERFNVQYYFGVSRRIGSTMFNPNNYASFIMLVSYPILMTALYTHNRMLKAVLSSLFILLSINQILTFSREGWLGFGVGMLVIAIIYSKKIFYLFLLSPIVLLVSSIRERIFSSFNLNLDANLTRIKLWKTGLLMIRDNPILGVGLGNSIYVYDYYIWRYHELNAGYTMYPLHNSYIKVQAETGILGIVSFLLMTFYIAYSSFKIFKRSKNPILQGISSGFFASSIGYLAMNFFDNCFFDPQTAVFYWLIFAVIVSLNNVDIIKAAKV